MNTALSDPRISQTVRAIQSSCRTLRHAGHFRHLRVPHLLGTGLMHCICVTYVLKFKARPQGDGLRSYGPYCRVMIDASACVLPMTLTRERYIVVNVYPDWPAGYRTAASDPLAGALTPVGISAR